MKNNNSLTKTKIKIGMELLGNILIAGIISFILYFILVLFFENTLSILVARLNYDLYAWIVYNREIVLYIYVGIVLAIILYRFISKYVNSINEVYKSLDRILEEDNETIKLPDNMNQFAEKINEIKYNYISTKNSERDAEQKKNDLIMYMAHDLKTPLTSVVAYLSMLDSHPEMPAEERAKYTQISLEKANRLGDLLKEFFESIKLNLQDIELDKVDIDLTMMLEQIADELYGVLQEKMLTCKVEAEEEILIEGDPDKLARVFDNILRNAIAYCREKSVLLIQAAKEENQVRICFENEGDTIPEESLKRIFDKFYRADAARSSSTGGAGLGLAIAKEIVELHKGQITAESSGGKTRFIVTLPLKGGVESNEIHTHSGHSSGGRAGRRKFLHRKAAGRTVE